MGAFTRGLRDRLRGWGPEVVVALAVAAFVAACLIIGLRFPLPWPDESSFLWPALALRDHGHLFAPEINPEREVLWMPPAFMVMHAGIFSIFPFTLERARAVSALLMACAVLSVFGMTRSLRGRWLHAALLCAFLLAPIVFVAGNVARMESLVLALVTGGFFLIGRGTGGGLALVLLAPLAHPNGVFAAMGGALYAGILLVRTRRRAAGDPPALRFRAGDLALLALCLVCWALYLRYVADHFDAFKADMAAQLRFKVFVSYGQQGALGRLTEGPVAIGLAELAVAGVLARRHRVPLLGLFILGGCFFVQTALAAGWLYDVYPTFALLVSTIVLVETLACVVAARLEVARRRFALVAVGVATAALLIVAGRTAFLTRSLDRATVSRDTLWPDYLTRADRKVVRDVIRQLVKLRGHVTIQCVPSGEGLVYESLRGPNVSFVEQTFFVSRFDVILVHDSVWAARFVHDLELLRSLTLMPQPPPPPVTIRSRDMTERWDVYLSPQPVPPLPTAPLGVGKSGPPPVAAAIPQPPAPSAPLPLHMLVPASPPAPTP